MSLLLPPSSMLDPECRALSEAMMTGKKFDPVAFAKHLSPEYIARGEQRMKAAQGFMEATPEDECLSCGVCCQQGWRVDVRETDYPRMSEATKAVLVEQPPRGAPAHVVGVLRILNNEDGTKKCAAQTTHEGKGCGIYEERPETCRTFPKGHERCVLLRVQSGLSVGLV